MKFLVPQFIEVEDKIFGPLSFRQFAYLAGGVGFAVIVYNYLGIFMALLLGAPFFIFGLMLAFYKINNRPFIYVVQSALTYFVGARLYLWKQQIKKKKAQSTVSAEAVKPFVPKVSENKLKDLAWSLDIKEASYQTPAPESEKIV